MTTSELFRKEIMPKIILIIFLVIAYQILKLFPIDMMILKKPLLLWIDTIINLFIVGNMLKILTPGKELLVLIVKDNVIKEAYAKWTDVKKQELAGVCYNGLIVIIILISYELLVDDINGFFEASGTISTLIKILIIILGLVYLYKTYQSLEKVLKKD